MVALCVLGRYYTALGTNNVSGCSLSVRTFFAVPLALRHIPLCRSRVLLRCPRAVCSRLCLSKAFRLCARRVAGIIRHRSDIVPRANSGVAVLGSLGNSSACWADVIPRRVIIMCVAAASAHGSSYALSAGVLSWCHRAVRTRLRLSKAFRPCARRVAGGIYPLRSAIVPCRAVPAVAVSL